ncbi:DNA recombination protein RmuC [Pelagicoccus sp. SDUM812002]|uniref:DNA recombination protein RmuC n=1 Tax=Pelagicoccus sp. SDUM812002 TaxID=3041266 RepID=UPI00280DE733|nr:DNA recombination protein RmuC [Pelagicoccus sp. SDUM812002]MDQ8184884.1 DNA recombination protein RmuC [Pelagicoccus sp. SDUM812002]
MIEEWAWLIALVAGFAAAWFIQAYRLRTPKGLPEEERAELEGRLAVAAQENAKLEERSRSSEAALSEAKSDIAQLREANTGLNMKLAGADQRIQSMDTRIEEQRKEVAELQKKLTAEFETLATRVLDANSEKFVARNKESLDKLLVPLAEKITDFRSRVETTHDQSVKDRAELVAQLKHLGELNQLMSTEARNLTTALKGQAKTQGNWGELVLATVLEKSGLVEGREYRTQASFTSEEGRRQQPDVLINLPEGKHLVIDAKVSLIAYERCVNEDDVALREVALKEHLQSVKNHVLELSKKRYDALYEIQSPDFTLMFIPVEPAFVMAIQADDTLFDYAFRQNVVIVTPSTLLATLRTVANIWRQEKQTRNAIDIAEKSGLLYDKFVGFFEDMQKIGEQISRSQDAYDAAMNKLSTGRGNLVNQVQRLKDLGAKAKKALPRDVVEGADEELELG